MKIISRLLNNSNFLALVHSSYIECTNRALLGSLCYGGNKQCWINVRHNFTTFLSVIMELSPLGYHRNPACDVENCVSGTYFKSGDLSESGLDRGYLRSDLAASRKANNPANRALYNDYGLTENYRPSTPYSNIAATTTSVPNKRAKKAKHSKLTRSGAKWGFSTSKIQLIYVTLVQYCSELTSMPWFCSSMHADRRTPARCALSF